MSEVELTSELVIAMIAGMQDKKKSIDEYYKRFDSKYPRRTEIEKRYKKVVDEISELMGDTLRSSQFRRTPLFYTMFLALYHRMYGIPQSKIPRGGSDKLASHERMAFRKAVDSLSLIVADARKDKIKKGYEAFVGASLRQTDNIRPRETRLKTLYELAFA